MLSNYPYSVIKLDRWCPKKVQFVFTIHHLIAISASSRLSWPYEMVSVLTDANELRPGQIDEWNTNSDPPGNMLRWDHSSSSCFALEGFVSSVSVSTFIEDP